MRAFKNETEHQIASYFDQENIAYELEPFPEGQKNPDFRISTEFGTVLIEGEEVESLQIDTLHAPEGGVRTFGFDPKIDWQRLRNNPIKHASRQLEPYAESYDYRVIIIGKPNGFDIKLHDLFTAVVGDERLVMDFIPSTGIAENPRWEPAVNGAMRKNNVEGEMVLHKQHISGIGLIKTFNGYEWYFRQIWDKLKQGGEGPTSSMEESIARGLQHADKVEQYIRLNGLPERFQDKERMFYRLEMIVNPIATRPLPKDLFSGEWDEVVVPEVTELS